MFIFYCYKTKGIEILDNNNARGNYTNGLYNLLVLQACNFACIIIIHCFVVVFGTLTPFACCHRAPPTTTTTYIR